MLLNLIRFYLENAVRVLKNPRFWYARLCYFVFYFGKRPFASCKEDRSNPSLTYGETSYSVFDAIAQHIKYNDRFVDLGCGRGLGLFYLATMVKARYLGLEIKDEFVRVGRIIKTVAGFQNIEFMQKDLHTYKLPACDVIFIAGTCFDEKLLGRICLEINRIKPRKVLSISTSLIEYGLLDYKIQDVPIDMPWGQTSLFVLSLTKQ